MLSLHTPIGLNTSGQIVYVGTNYSFYDMFVSPSQANDQAMSVLYGSGTTLSDADLGSAIAVSGN